MMTGGTPMEISMEASYESTTDIKNWNIRIAGLKITVALAIIAEICG